MASQQEDRRFEFNKTRLMALPIPAKGFVEYHDTKQPGLVMRVSYAGGKTFCLNRRVDGKPKRIKLGRFPDVSYEQACKFADGKKGDIAHGIDPTAKRRALREEPTLDELFELYLAEPRKRGGDRKASTIAEYRRIVETHLDAYRKRKVSLLTQDRMDELHKAIGAKSGPYVANRTLAVVKAVYTFGIDRKRLKIENPARGVVVFPEESRERRLHDDEVEKLFDVLDAKATPPDIRDFVKLALFTGARRSNLMAMRWEDVLPLEREIWTIPETKNGRPQEVHLEAPAIAILKARLAKRRKDQPYVFPGDGRTGHLVEPKKAWDAVLTKAGIENFRIHDLRRTLGSYAHDSGSSLELVGTLLGHKSREATLVYARTGKKAAREAMGKATDALLAAAGRDKKPKRKLKPVMKLKGRMVESETASPPANG